MKITMPNVSPVAVGAGLVLALGTTAAFAQYGGMPWEGPICKIAQSFSGPVAKSVSVIAIVICGLLMAFGELGGVFKTVLGLLMGVTMAVAAVQWMGAFTSGGGSLGCGISALEQSYRVAYDMVLPLLHWVA